MYATVAGQTAQINSSACIGSIVDNRHVVCTLRATTLSTIVLC